MRFNQAGSYPSCDAYLRTTVATYAGMCNLVSDAFRACCENDGLAEQALTPGRGPVVHVGDVGCGTNGQYRGRSGGPRDIVYINTRVADEYEIGGRWDIFESTVLHEMVHWARFRAGHPSRFNGNEAGKEFETRAYGRDISCGCYAGCEDA